MVDTPNRDERDMLVEADEGDPDESVLTLKYSAGSGVSYHAIGLSGTRSAADICEARMSGESYRALRHSVNGAIPVRTAFQKPQPQSTRRWTWRRMHERR